MEKFKDVVGTLKGGELLFIFEPNPQDRHEYSTFVVRKINNSVVILERPNGDIINVPLKNPTAKKVLIITGSPLVESTPTGWHFAQ